MVRERERQAAVTDGKASNVGHVKQSLMLKLDRFTSRKQDFSPERNVVVKKLDLEDSVDHMKAEEERKQREKENKRRLEAIQRMYKRDESMDQYNRDYLLYICSNRRIQSIPLYASMHSLGFY